MSKIKHDFSEKIKLLLKRKEFLTNELQRIYEIEGDLKSSLYKYQYEKCTEEYNEVEEKLFNFEKLTDREIFIELSKKKQLIKFLSMKDYIKMKDKFNEELKDVNERIRKYKGQQ